MSADRMSRSTMCRTLLWCVFFSFALQANGSPLQVMSAPNMLRVGATENIFVECQACKGDVVIHVEINVMNFPTKNKRLASTSVNLTSVTNFQNLAQIKIPAGHFKKDQTIKQYVYLQAQFPDRLLEKVVLVSFQSGYIFIQTDKTLYTPNSRVRYRMFAVTPGMEPMERDQETLIEASITIEIVTPEGIVAKLDPVTVKSGMHSGDYTLPEMASSGLWKVVAQFHSNPQEKFTAEFEVKEYVLPTFEVKLKAVSPFFHVDSREFTVNIEARNLYNQEVDGTAYGVFGILEHNQKRSLPGSVQRVLVTGGRGTVTLKREHITQGFRNITDLVGTSLYVAVSMLTESGSEMVEAELRGFRIVTSPYIIHFKRTSKYFKPGLSLDVTVEVLNPDESPAQGVTVVVNDDVTGTTSSNGMARLTLNTQQGSQLLTITAKTNDARLSPERQASATMTAFPYTSSSNSYLNLGVGSNDVTVGDNLKINLNLNRQQNEEIYITYLIMSRGQLVEHGHYKTQGQFLITLVISITKEMLPSFRIIAYYHPTENEVVSDSIWVDVKDTCMGTLKLEPMRPLPSYQPRRMFGLRVTGDADARVGLVAVDKGVYLLNNKHRLTQTKLWDIVEKYDPGCTVGGGKDSMSVFYDAGLLFESNTASGTPYRQELTCAEVSRRKRDTNVLDLRARLAEQYNETLQRECCFDGMRETPLLYTCERRSEYITNGSACVRAFVHCCQELEFRQDNMTREGLQLARSEEYDGGYDESNVIVSRSNFPESWLWIDFSMPSCSKPTENCETTYERSFPLQDSITTWQLTGISLSKDYGVCVSDPLEVIVRKEFFIELRMPYSVVRGEQVEIKAVLHNYSPDVLTVRVDLLEVPDVCSSASKHGQYRQEILLGPQTTQSVPFVVIPMTEGEHSIEVKASVKDSSLDDGIRKKLVVVPEGILTKSSQTIFLDPTNEGVGGRLRKNIRSGIPRIDLAPNTPTKTQVSVTGKLHESALLKNAIGGQQVADLLDRPSGCGEENMIYMSQTVAATNYIDKSNQWETVGFHRRYEALEYITAGYQSQLANRKPDGSFATYAHQQSSTWLTAFVAKVFTMANHLVAIKTHVICGAIKFLIVRAQQRDGRFIEVGRVSHREMIGDVLGMDSDASMTAFCLIAMQESRTLCSPTVTNLQASVDKASTYLEKRLQFLSNPYAVAMVSYALANENKMNLEILNMFSSRASAFWQVSKGHVYTLEATSYALLALVKEKAFDEAIPVVKWFNKQRRVGGSFGSTQATVLVYQALAEYWNSEREPEYNLDVDIRLPGRSKPDKYNLNKENRFATRTSKVNALNPDISVVAAGTGQATLTLVSLYYALPKENEGDCQNFNLSVQLIPENMADDGERTYKLKIEVLYKSMERDAGMSVLDIGLPTGFKADTNDLSLLSKGHARSISNYNLNPKESERSSVIIYLDSVSHQRPDQIVFRVRQKLRVGIIQPAAVFIYEYKKQTRCVKFYRPERTNGQLLRLCVNDECTCAEENCSMQKNEKINNDVRTAKVCETELNSKIDFAYKVRLEGFIDSLSTDIYTMLIEEVIKEGSYDVGAEGKLRNFLGYLHCRDALDLKTGKSYLIMGTSNDIYRDEQSQTYQYVLGERTWIEYWPTTQECQNKKFQDVCEGIDEMARNYAQEGCRQ